MNYFDFAKRATALLLERKKFSVFKAAEIVNKHRDAHNHFYSAVIHHLNDEEKLVIIDGILSTMKNPEQTVIENFQQEYVCAHVEQAQDTVA